jgi:carboxylate-amine ligase
MLDGDSRFKPELPAAQIEVITTPARTVAEAAAQLADGRRRLSEVAEGRLLLAAAGAHPFADEEAELNSGSRYRRTREEYGWVARRQLVFGLHVHVRVAGADRALAVYNAMRSYLPELAALAANAPFYRGRDTGLASIRPKISELLPRQGVPPAIDGLEQLADAWRWGARAGALPEARLWWWELRLHPLHGTVELRVPDQQTTVAEAAAVAAVGHALVGSLAERHDRGERLPRHPTWRIEENRWSACRRGSAGTMADLDTGEQHPTRRRLHDLLDELEPAARRLDCLAALASARELIDRGGAERQREAAANGMESLARWLASQFDA